MSISITVVLLLVLTVVFLVFFIVLSYNKGVRLRNYVKEAFSTMDVYLKKRWDLVPNLVECVKGYAKHENNILTEVTALRSKEYGSISQEEKLNINHKLAVALSKIMAVSENYPDLKANENFIFFMQNLNNIEGDIANSRKYYNGTVRELNTFLEVFPTNIIGTIFGMTKENMFEIESEQRQNIKVEFK